MKNDRTMRMMRVLMAVSPGASIKLDHEGRWFVSMPGAMIVDERSERSPYAPGQTPEDAVRFTHDQVTHLGAAESIRIAHGANEPRFVRWNGHMWDTVRPPRAEHAA